MCHQKNIITLYNIDKKTNQINPNIQKVETGTDVTMQCNSITPVKWFYSSDGSMQNIVLLTSEEPQLTFMADDSLSGHFFCYSHDNTKLPFITNSLLIVFCKPLITIISVATLYTGKVCIG